MVMGQGARMAPGELPPSDSLDGLRAGAAGAVAGAGEPEWLVCSATCAGVRCAPHCAQRFATARCYLCALAALALLLGAARGYLLATAHAVAHRYALPPLAVDLLLVGTETLQGLASLLVAHGGARAHRPSWLALPALLHAAALFAALAPFASHAHAHARPLNATRQHEFLCEPVTAASSLAEELSETCWVTLAALVMVVVTAGVAWAALLTHGLVYLDDNVHSTDSPSLLGAILGADRLGPPLGQILAYLCNSAHGDVTAGGGRLGRVWWLGWPLLGSMLLVTAFLMSMFPRRLPSAAVRERAKIILDAVCRRVRIDDHVEEIDLPSGLISTMKRLLKNRLVVFITLFLMFVYAPLHFFSQYENRYLESVYFIPEPQVSGGVFRDQWTSRVITGFMRPPIVLMTMLLSGMIIARKRPSASSLALWNAIVAFAVALIFFIFISLHCPLYINGLIENSLQLNKQCNADCSCPSNIPFLPVCDSYGINTYYSPCHAGCTAVEYIDDFKLYNECKCLKYERRAKEGACSALQCTAKWVLFQSLGVLISGLTGTCLIGSVLLCLRSVSPQDKTHSLAFIIMHVGATHLPGKFLYKVITDATCIYWGGDYYCQLFDSRSLAIWFNVLNGCLFLFATLFALLAWRHSKNVKLFNDELEDPDSVEMNEIRKKLSSRLSTPFNRRRRKGKLGYGLSDEDESENHESENEITEEHQNRQSEIHPLQQNSELHESERNISSDTEHQKRVFRATLV